MIVEYKSSTTNTEMPTVELRILLPVKKDESNATIAKYPDFETMRHMETKGLVFNIENKIGLAARLQQKYCLMTDCGPKYEWRDVAIIEEEHDN